MGGAHRKGLSLRPGIAGLRGRSAILTRYCPDLRKGKARDGDGTKAENCRDQSSSVGRPRRNWPEIQEGACRPVYLAAFERVGLRSGLAYLDAGCGAGMALQIAAERGARASGLDATDELLAIARTRVPDGDFRVGDLESLPFLDDTFDLVTGFNSFQFAGNPGIALTEAKRVAKPGASVVIMTWGKPEGMEAASLVAALGPLLPPPHRARPAPSRCRTKPRCADLPPERDSTRPTYSTSTRPGNTPISPLP